MNEQLIAQKEAFKGAFDDEMFKLDSKLVEIVKTVLEERLQKLSMPCQFFETVPKMGFSWVKYVQSDVSILRDGPGKLATSDTEPSLTVAEGQSLTEGVVGAECTFTVTTKNAAGQTTYSVIDDVCAKITALWSERRGAIETCCDRLEGWTLFNLVHSSNFWKNFLWLSKSQEAQS